jgi:glycosyltransferase involved in cell wall biosynthesis
MKKYKNIGIILTYNCADLVEKTFDRIPKGVLDQVIVADDGSTDDIAIVAKKLKIPLYRHAHSGYGGNIKFGLKKAVELGADFIVEIHGDGQYDPSVIPAALKKIHSGYDFLLGSRFTNLNQAIKEDHMPIARYLANIGLSFIAKIILQVNLTEVHTGFRVYSRNLVQTMGFKNTSNEHIYSFENIAQARFFNLRITEIPIHCDYAKDHTSISIRKSIIYSFDMFRVMGEYILAKMGLKRGLFDYSRRRNRNNKFSSPITKP